MIVALAFGKFQKNVIDLIRHQFTIAERDKDGKSYPCTQIGHGKNFKSTLWRSQSAFLEAHSPQKHYKITACVARRGAA